MSQLGMLVVMLGGRWSRDVIAGFARLASPRRRPVGFALLVVALDPPAPAGESLAR